MVYESLSKRILDCMYLVHRTLGPGLKELCYRNALWYALRDAGLFVEMEKRFEVSFQGHVVGEFLADLCVEGIVILELKSVSQLNSEHEAQLLNYLSVSGCPVGYLLNFRLKRLQFERRVLRA